MEHWQREISGWIEFAKRQIHLALAEPSLITSIVKWIFDRKILVPSNVKFQFKVLKRIFEHETALNAADQAICIV
jgi:hypothetical protein